MERQKERKKNYNGKIFGQPGNWPEQELRGLIVNIMSIEHFYGRTNMYIFPGVKNETDEAAQGSGKEMKTSSVKARQSGNLDGWCQKPSFVSVYQNFLVKHQKPAPLLPYSTFSPHKNLDPNDTIV